MTNGNVDTPKWKKFEELVGSIQKALSANATVKINDSIVGKSGKARQVDVSIQTVSRPFAFLAVIDCKDYAKPVDVADVDAFNGLVDDINAQWGAMVSASGYTGLAMKRGKEIRMKLLRLIDTHDHDWKAEIAIPCEFVIKRRTWWSIGFGMTSANQDVIPTIHNHDSLEVFTEGGTLLGTVKEIYEKKWSESSIPSDPGIHDCRLFAGRHFIKTGTFLTEVQVSIKYEVVEEHQHVNLPLENFSGFYDVTTGELTTTAMETIPISMEKIDELVKDQEGIPKTKDGPVIKFPIKDKTSKPSENKPAVS